MHRRGIILLLLALILAGNAQGTVTNIPASQDVYISMGTGNEYGVQSNQIHFSAGSMWQRSIIPVLAAIPESR